MIKLILEKADNGVIKIAEDDNHNGCGHDYQEKEVYKLEGDPEGGFQETVRFIEDLFADLGVEVKSRDGGQYLNISVQKAQKESDS